MCQLTYVCSLWTRDIVHKNVSRICCAYYIYLDPAKDVFFSGEGNFQAKLKKPTQQTVLVSIFVTSALFFVTSASFWRHVFYREFAACFCVMFSGETEKKTSFQGPGIYIGVIFCKRMTILMLACISLSLTCSRGLVYYCTTSLTTMCSGHFKRIEQAD